MDDNTPSTIPEEIALIHEPPAPDEIREILPEPELTRFDFFDEACLSGPINEALAKIGWTKPTPVQGLCLPYTLIGRDVAGFAQTGTGKTGVFLLTIAERYLKAQAESSKPAAESDSKIPSPFGVVLVPTRELATQIKADADQLLTGLGMATLDVIGGVDVASQTEVLKGDVPIVIGTPGRFKDLMQRRKISLKHTQVIVLDEADRMFAMGFLEDMQYFFEHLNPKAQRLLFSATTNEQVKELAFEYLERPEYISVNPETVTPENIEQHLLHVESKEKLQVLMGLIQKLNPERAIIFANTKIVADWLHFKLAGNGLPNDVLTGDLSQPKRVHLIQRLRANEIKLLIATDVASRGLHVSGITHVFNFDLPEEAASYVHRIGRTARAGAKGQAYSLVCEDYGSHLLAIQEMVGPQCPLHTVWAEPEFLSIADQAGNPFDDPAFKKHLYGARGPRGASGYEGRRDYGGRPGPGADRDRDRDRDRERTTRPHERDRARPQRGERPDRNQPKKRSFVASTQGLKDQKFDREQTPRSNHHGRNQDRDRQSAKRAFLNHDEKHKRRPPHRRAEDKASRSAPFTQEVRSEAENKGFIGTIKAFFGVMFGKKPKG